MLAAAATAVALILWRVQARRHRKYMQTLRDRARLNTRRAMWGLVT